MNHLIHETSPYLLQHAHIRWTGTLGKRPLSGRGRKQAIFLSSAMRPALVPRDGSGVFRGPEIARVQRPFISHQVDREERPDVDAIYMNAVQLMTGSGGWPLSSS